MTLEEIKTAVDAGEVVHWATDSYTVIKDQVGQYLIAYMPGTWDEDYIGLTWRDNKTLNGASRKNSIWRREKGEYRC